MKILVSNLNFDATEQDIQQLFNRFGDVESVHLVKGWDDDESRGIAVVEIHKRLNGEQAIKNLNRSLYMEQVLNINEIRSPYFQSASLLTQY
jgi:RNA recognition motif-containing protein